MKRNLLCIFALLLTAVTGVWAADDSGSCGEVSFSYVESTHTLTISGTGVMADYDDYDERPWDSYAKDIKTLIIENGVTSIGVFAFYNCSALTSVTIPNSVTDIREFAFRNCSSMTTVTIGTGVTYIGPDAFYLCTAVTDVNCNADPAALTWEEAGCDDFKEDGSTVIHVANAAPWYAKFLDVVHGHFRDSSTVPFDWDYDSDTKTLTFIGTEPIPSYGDADYRPWIDYVPEVEKIVINDGVWGIGMNAFYECSALTSVTIPDNVKTIGKYAFQSCSSMTTVIIGTGVTYIGRDAFYGCDAVTDVYCNADPAALTWDEDYCDDFKYDGTTVIHVADASPWIAKFTGEVHAIFRDPSTVPFSWNYDADTKTLTISGTEAIPSYDDSDDRPWFDYVSEIEKIVINDGVKGIGKNAFRECSVLPSVTIPNSVTSIGGSAFAYCSELSSVTIPSSVMSIGDNPFRGDDNLTTLTVDAGNTAFKIVDGMLLTIGGEKIICCEYGKTSVTIPSSVTEIGRYAFANYSGLTNITIPDNVTDIDERAFYRCEDLTTVTIGSGVTYIGSDAFFGCTAVTDVYCNADPDALTWEEDCCDDFKDDGTTIIHVADAAPWIAKFTGEVNGIFRDPSFKPFSWNYDSTTKTLTISGKEAIPSYNDSDYRPWIDYVPEIEKIVINDGVWGIGRNAFRDCSALTSVTIPNSVRFIKEEAFTYCSELSSVTIPSSVTSIEDNPFYGDYKLTSLTVDAGNTAFKMVDGMLLTIGGEKIIYCLYGKSSVTIPSYVTEIGRYAFAGYSGLTNIVIPNNVSEINGCAFAHCADLTTVTIGSGVSYIGPDAFYGCTAVTDVYCYANPDYLHWYDGECDDFMDGKATECHVTDATKFIENWSTGDPDDDVNVTFVGNLAPKSEPHIAGEEYWSSYYNSAAHLKADDNTTVYKASLSGSTVTLTEISDKVITAGQAVLLKKTTSDPVVLTPCASASEDDYSDNDLEGVDEATAKESGSDYYVLYYEEENSKLSFYKYSGATLGANKAFFKVPANSSREFFDIAGETTGVDGRCKMSDGRSDVYYDLNGRKVANGQLKKGIYIVNGHKVIIK